ncbi:MAG: patatin-like phospholipase family protein [Anaerolineales bacterium]|jgi:NTE family protein
MDISLALGGGGSRGYAHIGVLRCLESAGFHIRAVSGASAGGIVAVAYAAGYTPDQMEETFARLDQSKIFARSPNEGPGILGLSKAAMLFEELFGNRTFSDLRIPCAVVAVDLKGGREIVLNQGHLVDAILATIAVPGVFPPKQYGDIQLVDGAVLDPVPVSVARSLAPGLPVVAVNLAIMTEATSGFISLPLPVQVPPMLAERLTRTRVAKAFNIFLQSVDVSSRNMAELRLRIDHPEVVIRPDVDGVGLLDNVDIHQIIQKGEEATVVALPELRQAVAWPNRLRRYLSRQI